MIKLTQVQIGAVDHRMVMASGSFDPKIHVPGMWRCSRCGFVLCQSNLNAQDGTITARDQPGDRCPNCDVTLWRLSWRQHATDMAKVAEDAIDRAAKAEAELQKLRAATK